MNEVNQDLTTRRRFRGWLGLSIAMATFMVAVHVIAKIPERWESPELHWLTGRVSLDVFVLTRVAFISLFSVLVSGVATLLKKDPPFQGDPSQPTGL